MTGNGWDYETGMLWLCSGGALDRIIVKMKIGNVLPFKWREGTQQMPFYPYHHISWIASMKQPSTNFSYLTNNIQKQHEKQTGSQLCTVEAMLRER